MINFKIWLQNKNGLINEASENLIKPFTDPINGITYKFSEKIGDDGKQLYTRTKGKYIDDQSYVYKLDYAKDRNGNEVKTNFNTKLRVELRKALRNIEKYNSLSNEEKQKIKNNKSGLLFVGRGNTISGQMANKDNVTAHIGNYKCHKDGKYIVFQNINDETDNFKYEMSVEQFKKVRVTFNEKSTRNGIETNKYKIDPTLITREAIIHRINRVLGIKNTDTVNSGTSLNKKYEQDIANKLDDVLGNDVVKHNIEQKDQKYYAIGTGDDSKKSDVMAVHDRKEFNTEKLKTTKKDSKFFIEVKLHNLASFLNPFFTWTIQDGFKTTHKYGIDDVDQETGDKPSRDENIEDKKIFEIPAVSNILEDILNENCNKQMEVYYNMLVEIMNKMKIDISKIEFPKSIQEVITESYKLIDTNETDVIKMIEEFIRKYNEIKLKNNFNGYKRGEDGSLYILSNKNIDNKQQISKILEIITKYYRNKGCAYIQIGPLGNDNTGNLYILDDKYDPLNLKEKNQIPLFSSIFTSCRLNVSWQFKLKRLYIAGTIRFPSESIHRSEISIDDNTFTVDKITTTGDFFNIESI